MNLEGRLTPWTPQVLSILRIVAGLIFLEHGTQKLLGFPPGEHAGRRLSRFGGRQPHNVERLSRMR